MNDFGKIFNWKLHTPADYLGVAIILLVSFILVYLYIQYAKKRRNDQSAILRVGKKLTRLISKASTVINNANLMIDNEQIHFDHIVIDGSGILLVKTFGRGTNITARAEDESWAVADAHQNISIPNPVLEMSKHTPLLLKILSKNDLYNIDIIPIAVFADNYGGTSIYSDKGEPAISFERLPRLLRERDIRIPKFSIDAVSSALKATLVD